MQYFRTLAIGLLLVSCATDEPEMETTPAVPEATGEKIAGGSVLQVFFLRGNQTKGTDIVDKTNANWLAMSPLISLEQQNSGEYRPYEFPVSQETLKMKEARILQGTHYKVKGGLSQPQAYLCCQLGRI